MKYIVLALLVLLSGCFGTCPGPQIVEKPVPVKEKIIVPERKPLPSRMTDFATNPKQSIKACTMDLDYFITRNIMLENLINAYNDSPVGTSLTPLH